MNWEKEINIIRGKNLVGKAEKKDVDTLLSYIDLLENKMDDLDLEDFFGTEGWRHFFGLD